MRKTAKRLNGDPWAFERVPESPWVPVVKQLENLLNSRSDPRPTKSAVVIPTPPPAPEKKKRKVLSTEERANAAGIRYQNLITTLAQEQLEKDTVAEEAAIEQRPAKIQKDKVPRALTPKTEDEESEIKHPKITFVLKSRASRRCEENSGSKEKVPHSQEETTNSQEAAKFQKNVTTRFVRLEERLTSVVESNLRYQKYATGLDKQKSDQILQEVLTEIINPHSRFQVEQNRKFTTKHLLDQETTKVWRDSKKEITSQVNKCLEKVKSDQLDFKKKLYERLDKLEAKVSHKEDKRPLPEVSATPLPVVTENPLTVATGWESFGDSESGDSETP